MSPAHSHPISPPVTRLHLVPEVRLGPQQRVLVAVLNNARRPECMGGDGGTGYATVQMYQWGMLCHLVHPMVPGQIIKTTIS